MVDLYLFFLYSRYSQKFTTHDSFVDANYFLVSSYHFACAIRVCRFTTEVRSPLKGLGVGLSLSRWHMRHFSGDLTLERRAEGAVRVRKDSGRRSKWHVLGKGMTATIKIPKNASIPLVIS